MAGRPKTGGGDSGNESRETGAKQSSMTKIGSNRKGSLLLFRSAGLLPNLVSVLDPQRCSQGLKMRWIRC